MQVYFPFFFPPFLPFFAFGIFVEAPVVDPSLAPPWCGDLCTLRLFARTERTYRVRGPRSGSGLARVSISVRARDRWDPDPRGTLRTSELTTSCGWSPSMADPRLLVAVPSSPDLIDGLARWLPDVPYIRPDKLGEKPWPSIEAAFVANVDREMPSVRPAQVPRLRFVQFLFTGLDGFPFHRFAPEVQVASNRGAYGPFVAEHAVALALALSKNVGRGQEIDPGREDAAGPFVDVPRWPTCGDPRLRPDRPRDRSTTSWSGNVHRRISRTGNADPGADQMTSIAHLSEALSRADVIVNCLPLTPSTRGIIGSEELGQLKPEAILVNVGRAATIDEDALVGYVKGHPDLRFGSDVWWDEDFVHGKVEVPPALKDLPNLLGTPHTAGLTADSRKFVLDNALQNVARYFHGERPQVPGGPGGPGDGRAGSLSSRRPPGRAHLPARPGADPVRTNAGTFGRPSERLFLPHHFRRPGRRSGGEPSGNPILGSRPTGDACFESGSSRSAGGCASVSAQASSRSPWYSGSSR